MSTDRDVTQSVRSWLDEGVTALPDRVLDSVLDQLPATPQRRATPWPVRRFLRMNSIAKFGLVAAAVVVAALLGFNYFIGPNIGGPGLENPSPTATPSPSQVAALNGQDPLAAGRYQADPALPMDVTIEVPAGWSAGTSWVVVGPNDNAAPDGMAIRFYTAANIYTHPLVPTDGLVSPQVGPTADELVAALVAHPDWNATGTAPVTMDGYTGQVVHITLPEGTTDAAPFYLFEDAAGGQVFGWSATQVFDIYIVDVGGDRLVIDAFHFADTSETDLAAQQAVLDSIQITETP